MVFKFSWLLIEAEKDEDEEELDEEELGWLLFICLRYEGQVALTLISKRRIIDDLNGIEVEDIKYINDERHGVIKLYFSNGKIKKETTYKYGEKQGKHIVYYKNGNKKEEAMFTNDVKHGMSFFYDEAGKIKTKKEYFNGKIYKIENL